MQIRPTGKADAGKITTVPVAVWREIHPDLVPAEVLAGLSVERRAADSERGVTPGMTQWTMRALVGTARVHHLHHRAGQVFPITPVQ